MIFFISFVLIFVLCERFYPDDNRFTYIGRYDSSHPKAINFDWSSFTISVRVKGSSFTIFLDDWEHYNNFYDIFIDNDLTVFGTNSSQTEYTFQTSSSDWHDLSIIRRTEAMVGVTTFLGLEADDIQTWRIPNTRNLLFLGDSMTVGFGIEGKAPCNFSLETESSYPTYDGLIGRHFNADCMVVAWSGKGLVRNFGEIGRLSKQPLPYYLDLNCGSDLNCGKYDFSKSNFDAVFIYLGGNDFSSDIYAPTKEEFMNGYLMLMGNLTNYIKSDPYYFFVCGDYIDSQHLPWCNYVEEQVDIWSKKGLKVTFIDNNGLLKYPEEEGCGGHPNVKGHSTWAKHMILIIEEATKWR